MNNNKVFRPEGYIFKLYPLLVAIFVILRTEAIIFVNKQILIFGITTTVSGITLTINFLILAVVTNCYGKQSARQLIWINNLLALQFIGYNFIAQSLSWAPNIKNFNLIENYQIMIPLFVKASGFGILGENVADFLFVFLYSRNKNKRFEHKLQTSYFKEYFILFKYSFIANFAMLSVAYNGIFFGHPIKQIVALICQVLLIKTIIEILLSPIAIFLILKIKKFEKFDLYDLSGNNPFTFLINYQYLNFNQISNTDKH